MAKYQKHVCSILSMHTDVRGPMYCTCLCSDQETVVRTSCGEGPWVQRLALEFRNLGVALDPPPHANSVTLGELFSLPEA